MTNGHSIIAVNEDIKTAGAIVWWRLRGGLSLEALKKAWEAARLPSDWLPEEPSPAVALHRALGEQRRADVLVRPLLKEGWALVREHKTRHEATGEELEYKLFLKVSLDKVGRLAFAQGGDTTVADEIREAFVRFQSELIGADVSAWLSRLIGESHAVSLRDTGGVYFIPRSGVDTWGRIVEAVRAASAHIVANVPALSSQEALRAIEDALNQDAERELTAMENELADGELGKRALDNRLTSTEALSKKLGTYEEVLGAAQVRLRERIEQLRANITRAVFTLESQKEASEEGGGASFFL